MKKNRRIRDYGIIIGNMKTGEKNLITDVRGVRVGHITLDEDKIKTGVTVILPHKRNTFKEKVIAASHIINGFGKTIGIIQIEELGEIETPIVLTNTLSVGIACDALIEYMLKTNYDICKTTGTVNPIICECNDEYLNDIRGRHLKKEHIFAAIENAQEMFEEGAVGAGTGMSCYQLKGGIGSSSRVLMFDNTEYTVGVLVLTNMGKKEDLIIKGKEIGKRICEIDKVNDLNAGETKGSLIIILATDIPLTFRQLKRISKRAVVGSSKTGSFIDNGSGEIVIAFSTGNKVLHYEPNKIVNIRRLNENYINLIFRAVAESTEEAILNSLITAKTTIGRDGNKRNSLKEYIEKLEII
jgi:D-aminopeptidase